MAPRKQCGSSAASTAKAASNGCDVTEAAEAAPEKRGRGRPRKYPIESRPTTPAVKRGRGRPPKQPTSTITTAAPKAASPKEGTRGRGRPKKEAPARKTKAAEQVEEEDDEEEDEDEVQPPPAKRGRGRPKKESS